MAWYLETKDLSVGYNKTALIHDINIGIEKGEIVTLIGPNGAGKSTILKSITRQLELIAGTVTIQNEDLHAISYKNLATKMAVVLTDRMKPELMTCYEVVATGRYPYTGRLGILTKEDEKKVEEAMAAVHAVELGNRDFNEISDGQKQRILLARAICQEPEIIILDEPTSFLDIRYKLDLLSILRNMAKEKNITVIMSLHEIDLAQKVADKILCVKGDQIAHYGKPEEIFEENTIRELYDIDNGFFDPLFGSIELKKVSGASQVFVLSSCGGGIPLYRQLQKQEKPFAAGILYTNDVDYQLARLLAGEVVQAAPFETVSDAAVERALQLVESCQEVWMTSFPITPLNEKVQKVIDAAKAQHKLIVME
ncbi:MAG: ABC transporter ATP-binding protein [Lachnospiraceae bacterium]